MNKKETVTIFLMAVNGLVFLVLSMLGDTEDVRFMLNSGAMYVPEMTANHSYYPLFTSMFLHFGFPHLANNMLMLFLLGRQLEFSIGKVRFTCIYLISGLGGNLLSFWYDQITGDYAVSAGASGAIFGIVGALLYIAIRNHGRIGELSGKGIVFMIVLSLYMGITSSGIDIFAHIGGLVSGFLAAVLLYRKGDLKRSSMTGF